MGSTIWHVDTDAQCSWDLGTLKGTASVSNHFQLLQSACVAFKSFGSVFFFFFPLQFVTSVQKSVSNHIWPLSRYETLKMTSVLVTALTWTPGRRLQRTLPDMAPAWSSRVRWRPENAPASPSPAPTPGWPRRQPLCSGPHLLCPRCSPRAPPAAAHASYIYSADGLKKKRERTRLERRDSSKEAAFCKSGGATQQDK